MRFCFVDRPVASPRSASAGYCSPLLPEAGWTAVSRVRTRHSGAVKEESRRVLDLIERYGNLGVLIVLAVGCFGVLFFMRRGGIVRGKDAVWITVGGACYSMPIHRVKASNLIPSNCPPVEVMRP